MGGPHRVNAVNVLHFAIYDQVGVIKDNGAFPVEDVRHDDGIRNAGFIFDTEKQQSFGRAGALAADDAAGDSGRAAVVYKSYLGGRRDAERVQLFAMKGHGVFADS